MKTEELRQETPAQQILVLSSAIRGWLTCPNLPASREAIRDLTYALGLCALHCGETAWSPTLSRKPLYRLRSGIAAPLSRSGTPLRPGVAVHLANTFLPDGTPTGMVNLRDPETGETWENVPSSDVENVPIRPLP